MDKQTATNPLQKLGIGQDVWDLHTPEQQQKLRRLLQEMEDENNDEREKDDKGEIVAERKRRSMLLDDGVSTFVQGRKRISLIAGNALCGVVEFMGFHKTVQAAMLPYLCDASLKKIKALKMMHQFSR
jgi:hypothetical protein